MEPFVLKVLLGCVLVALIIAPMGCIGLWNGMVFFGDTLSHVALFAAVVSLLLPIPFLVLMLIIGLSVAFVFNNQETQNYNYLAIFSAIFLALSMALLQYFPQLSGRAEGLLFGDILTIDNSTLIACFIFAIIIIGYVILNYRSLLLFSINADLANTYGVNSKRQRLIFLCLYGIVMGLGIQLFGALLVPALAFLPAIIVRPFCKNPKVMLFKCTIMAVCLVLVGAWGSFELDMPLSPLIILCGGAILLISRALNCKRLKLKFLAGLCLIVISNAQGKAVEAPALNKKDVPISGPKIDDYSNNGEANLNHTQLNEFQLKELQLKFENFLSVLETLEAPIVMTTIRDQAHNQYNGHIWIDRKIACLRLQYGKNLIIAKDNKLMLHLDNQAPQIINAADTPAGLLLQKSVKFNGKKISAALPTYNSQNVWAQSCIYSGFGGEVKFIMFFRIKPFITLLGWSIVNADGSITMVHLDPQQLHMSVPIDAKLFNFNK